MEVFYLQIKEFTVECTAEIAPAQQVLYVYFARHNKHLASIRIRDALRVQYPELDCFNALWRYAPNSMTAIDRDRWRVCYDPVTLFDI